MSLSRRDRQWNAGIMIAVGLMIMALCGSCTFNIATKGGLGGMEYVVGGLPTLGGVWIFVWGLRDLWRLRSEDPKDGGDD